MLNKNEFYAYGQDRAGLEAVMRFHAVKRWHMIDTTRIQTLAEHSANVALLAYYIAKTAPGMAFGPANHVATYALMHDLPEVFTGDIPSITKPHLAGVASLEKALLPKLFNIEENDAGIRLLVKICDLADGIRFIRLHGVDSTARLAREGVEAQLEIKKEEAKCWPKILRDKVWSDVIFYAYEQS